MLQKHGSPIEPLGDDRQRDGGLRKGRRLEGWRVRGLEGLLKTGKAKEKAFYLAEDAEDAEL